MSRKRHVVQLRSTERTDLVHLIRAGVASARTLTHARILLHADVGVPGRRWTDVQIAAAVAVSARTVARVRAAFTAGGVAQALRRKPPTRVYPRKLDGAAEAALITLACSPAPPGRARWTLRLLGDRLVELEIVDGIAPNTVRTTLKKTTSSRG